MKHLPVAKTELKEIVESGCLYVDKTMYIKQLVDDKHKYYFLSRPRRFGKSLFIDTMKEAFEGNRELFKGLYLENNWDWEEKYPVIKISFGGGSVSTTEELAATISFSLKITAEKYKIELTEQFIPKRFHELIIRLSEKYNQAVVILIDEYDKPLLDNLTDEVVYEIRKELASFYSVLKDASAYLKLVFLTGVSKFSKTSIFSKLNNLTDLSMVSAYADICGITQNDLETVFVDYLKDVDLQHVKLWYDGYNFRGQNLYNPYDLLMFLWEKRYKPYWFQTGTPTFLLELIKERKFFVPQLDTVKIFETQLEEFDINNIDLEVLLFQTGYLTIGREYQFDDNIVYELKIPNKEVRKGLTDYLFRMFYANALTANERTRFAEKVYFALAENRPNDLEQIFSSFFSSIPHEWYRKNHIAHFEGFYSSLFYATFAALGLTSIPEDPTNKGKMDLTVIMDSAIYIFEFKMKTNPQNALQQIKSQKYYEKYLSHNKEIYLVGIDFDEDQKNISTFEYENLSF